jgi:hypothetical protein
MSNPKIIDLVGQTFGRLTVISFAGSEKKRALWLCRCVCGNEVIAIGKYLRKGTKKSCGCLHKGETSVYFKDLTGKQFGRLTVIGLDRIEKYNKSFWKCKCICGKEIVSHGNSLTSGNTVTCGHCFQVDLTGKVFGNLTVLGFERGGDDDLLYWKCYCDLCGNTKLLRYDRVVRGSSCGCLQNALAPGEVGFNILLARYKNGAAERKLPFLLSEDYFRTLTKQPCHYCGREPYTIAKGCNHSKLGGYTYNGIDRMDSSKGYEEGNVVTCCKVCNYAKSTLSYNDFLDWVVLVYKNRCGEVNEQPQQN